MSKREIESALRKVGSVLHHVEYKPEMVRNFHLIPFPKTKNLKKGRVRHLREVFKEGTAYHMDDIYPLISMKREHYILRSPRAAKGTPTRRGFVSRVYKGDLYVFYHCLYDDKRKPAVDSFGRTLYVSPAGDELLTVAELWHFEPYFVLI